MKGSAYFEQISAGAISRHMPECKAIIIHLGNQKHLQECLEQLYSAGDYKIYVVNSTLARLEKVLDRCREAGVPAIVNCGKELPGAASFMPAAPYSAALISPGSGPETVSLHASRPDSNILRHILDDPFALHFAHLGFQTYLYDPAILDTLREKYFEDIRLGILREDITLCEPVLRDANFIFFDFRSIKYSDYPCPDNANPNGLYAEEACRIARYAGLSQQADAFFLYGEPEAGQTLTICNKLTAQIIWHLCEGIASNLIEQPDNKIFEDTFLRKIVRLGQEGQEIVFIMSSGTGRCWMEIPLGKTEGVKLIPCSLKDYQTACLGDVPVRWLFFYQKYTNL